MTFSVPYLVHRDDKTQKGHHQSPSVNDIKGWGDYCAPLRFVIYPSGSWVLRSLEKCSGGVVTPLGSVGVQGYQAARELTECLLRLPSQPELGRD